MTSYIWSRMEVDLATTAKQLVTLRAHNERLTPTAPKWANLTDFQEKPVNPATLFSPPKGKLYAEAVKAIALIQDVLRNALDADIETALCMERHLKSE